MATAATALIAPGMTTSPRPVPKVAAAGAGGTLATLLITLAQALGLHLAPEAAGAIVALVSFASGYLRP